MTQGAHRAASLAVVASALAACVSSADHTNSDAADNACPGTTAQAIVNGSIEESYLGIDQDQIRAIIEVIDGAALPDAGGPLCSGVFVAPTWVATAGHCLEIQNAEVVVPAQGQGSPGMLRVVQSVRHPTLDVALLRVDASAADAAADGGGAPPVPIPVAGVSVAGIAVGDAIEVAGYGLTQDSPDGGLGALRFLVESITEIEASSITVSGFGESGACDGDSGGPLLARGADGSVQVAGVLSLGSATCNEDDTYVRLDAIHDWVQSVTGAYASADRACGGIPAMGRCFYGSAVWCSSGQIGGQACSGATSCGWDPSQEGDRCVPPSGDPCEGVDSTGRCRDGVALQCASGVLQRHACGCHPCRIDGATGHPRCSGS